MNRRTVAGLVLATVVVSSVGGWVAGSQIRSPAEVAARTAPPVASPILVPAELRTLSTDIVTRGTARFGSPRLVSLAASALKVDPAVVTRLPLPGDELNEGDVALTASGRPAFVLAGAVPTYRDLSPGLHGDDVRQLEEALKRLGFDPGPIDGSYDEATEAGVAAWYEASGYAPFEATRDQLETIRALESDAANVQLDALSADDAVAAAEADLASAQSAHTLALALSEGGSIAIDAATAESDSGNQAAAVDVANKQAALDELRTGTPASSGEIRTAKAELAASQNNAELVRLEGIASVVTAQLGLVDATEALTAAQRSASAANDIAALEVAARRSALDALQLDPTTPSSDIAAAQAELALATATAESVRLDGIASIDVAQRQFDRAPGEISAAQVSADAADRATSLDVSARSASLEALRSVTPGSATEIRLAEAELAAAITAAEAARLAGVELVAAARAGDRSAAGDLVASAAAFVAAHRSLENARSASDSRSSGTTGIGAQLDDARRRAGIQVPADELIFVDNTPLRVSETSVVPGDPAVGPVMTVTDSVVAVDASLPLEEAPLVSVGMTVVIDEPDLGISAAGVISRIADTPGTDGVDGFHIYIEVLVDGAPAGLVGASVRLTISIEATGGQVLAVPVAALTLAGDGTSRVQRQGDGSLEYVTVKPGLSAGGFVGVTPVDGMLLPDDLVVVGFDQAATAGG